MFTADSVPFVVEFERGRPVYVQVAEGAMRAILRNQLEPGDTFPAAYDLVKTFRIHPSSAARAIAELQKSGWLVRRGSEFVVAKLDPARQAERLAIVSKALESVVREARRLGVQREEAVHLLDECWNNKVSTP